MIGLNKIWLNQVQLNRLYLNAPFPVYRKMTGGGSSGDGFPVLPGDVTRWHFGGLTNEMMAAMDDPRLEDADGKGRFLSVKNFAWKGMSGVGGYGDENYLTFYKFTLDDYVFIASPPGVEHMNFTFRVTGLQPGNKLTLAFFGTTNTVYSTWDKDGIYTVNSAVVEVGKPVYFYNGYGSTRGEFTIEIFPLYPGFILGDGVDDFAVTEKELNFEDTYTVYTAFIPFQDDPSRNMILCGKNDTKDFSINYSGTHLNFKPSTGVNLVPHINQFTLLVCKRNKDVTTIINLSTGESNSLKSVEFIANPGLYYLWRNVFNTFQARAAIAGQTICNGHYSTDEDDEKVFDWYKKQYPWLFPDQAWTVTGKTNQDEDRATIVNITGNGNDLVLSNFGFAEGSGYGLYYQYFGNEFKATNGEIEGGGWNIIDNYNISHDKRIPINSIGKCFWGNKALVNGIKLRFKLTGMTEGDVLAFGYAATYDLTYTSDGIYAIDLPPVDKSYGFSLQSSLTENLPTTPVTIELLPFEYEGYLVTDGVDDKVQSSSFTMNEDWTIVGDWELLSNVQINCGIVKAQNVYLYNIANGLLISINNPRSLQSFGTKSLHAICSDGRLYDRNWVEYKYTADQNFSIVESSLNIGFNLNNYTQMAFKNLGIYNNQLLSKDDCIKAYNYLQTLKAK